MPFGLKNAPPTFQRLVDRILADLLGRGVYAYIDDILIYTETMEEHWTLLGEVLERIRAAGLKISLDKSEWLRKEVQYLGYVIGQGVLKMDPSKTEDILRIPIPPDTREEGRYKPDLRKQVRRFLGATGFYRKFIRDYATVAAPHQDHRTHQVDAGAYPRMEGIARGNGLPPGPATTGLGEGILRRYRR